MKQYSAYALLLSLFHSGNIATVTSNTNHKIFFLISIPRSMTTATLRAIHNRGDFTVFNEPGVVTFFRASAEGVGDNWAFQNNLPVRTYESIVSDVIKASQKTHVFVKELGFVAREYLPNSIVLQNPDAYFVFLIRNPHSTIVSYYTTAKASPLSEELSYKNLLNLFNTINEQAFNKPIVILAETLASRPQETMQKMCTYVGIPSLPESLQWTDMSKQVATQSEWFMTNECYFTKTWHLNSLKSTGFHSLPSYARDGKGMPTFEEVEERFRDECTKLYAEQKPYYQKFLSINKLKN